ncbi:MAG: aminoglycoside phosphotransferase family protein [Actinoplanes sp.]
MPQQHADELPLSVETVRALVDAQLPAARGLPVRPVARGTVNAIFRLGDRYTARFPLRPAPVEQARAALEREAAAAAELAGRTRFRTPEPVALGEPGAGYPMPWSVQTWLSGAVGTEQDPAGSEPFAHDLAEFVEGVRAIPVRGRTFSGDGRGGDLREHDDWVQTCLARSESLLDVPLLRRLWAGFRDLPRGEHPDTMNHGDLMPANVLVADGRLTGVLDVGGFGPADRSLDLIGAWDVLDDGPRRVFRDRLNCDDLEWERGRAWAFEQAMGLVWYYRETNPSMSRTGRRTLDRLTRNAT